MYFFLINVTLFIRPNNRIKNNERIKIINALTKNNYQIYKSTMNVKLSTNKCQEQVYNVSDILISDNQRLRKFVPQTFFPFGLRCKDQKEHINTLLLRNTIHYLLSKQSGKLIV